MMVRNRHRHVILTAVLISVIFSMFLDLITPDLYTLIYFQQQGQYLLFKYGLIGIVIAVIMAVTLKNKKVLK